MARAERAWAASAGAAIFWLSKLAGEFGRVMINRRFWPTNLVRRMGVIPLQCHACYRMPIHVEYGSSRRVRWRAYEWRTVRVACQGAKPDKSNPKEEMTFPQLGGADPEWQALAAAPEPPPGAPASRAAAGAAPPWPAAIDPNAAQSHRRKVELEQPDDIVEDVGQQAREQGAQRRRETPSSHVKRAATENQPERRDQAEEATRLLQQIAWKQNQQGASLNRLFAAVSGQMEAVATPQSKVQSLARKAAQAAEPIPWASAKGAKPGEEAMPTQPVREKSGADRRDIATPPT
ncbi:unnamed protein product, partial [Prorocentrum cordatum]